MFAFIGNGQFFESISTFLQLLVEFILWISSVKIDRLICSLHADAFCSEQNTVILLFQAKMDFVQVVILFL